MLLRGPMSKRSPHLFRKWQPGAADVERLAEVSGGNEAQC